MSGGTKRGFWENFNKWLEDEGKDRTVEILGENMLFIMELKNTLFFHFKIG